jgi:hypothetical protein
MLRLLLVAGLFAGLLSSSPAGAAPRFRRPPTPTLIDRAVDQGRLSRARGNLLLAYALAAPARLPRAFRSDAPWHGTVAALRVQRALRTMSPGPARRRIAALVSPRGRSLGPGDPGLGACLSSAAPMTDTYQSPHFYIEYNAATLGGGLTIQDYAASLEGAWVTQVDRFAWAGPPVYGPNPPPNRKYHVRIDELSPLLYGFVSNTGTHAGPVGDNPNTPWNEGDAEASCMVLNRDFSSFPGGARAAMNATTAHEFNHSIQYGYGALSGANLPDDIYIEGGATWMEDEVYDGANDNYNYLWPVFEDDMGQYDDSPYPYWITFRGLTERFGTGIPGAGENVMQRFWEQTSRNAASNLVAMDKSLSARGTSLGSAYHAYAIAAKFNKKCGGDYVLPYCFEEGPQYVQAAGSTSAHGTISGTGGSHSGEVPDNLSLNWVALPKQGAYSVTLRNTSAGGRLKGTIACDTGTRLRLVPFPSVVAAGGSSRIAGFRSGDCIKAVAVITNNGRTAANPTESVARSYTLSTSAS